jgi:nucleotide-binding universal stress UspA family protein
MSQVIGRVVVGVDGTLGSLQALRYAVNHARTFNGVLVPVLAWTPPGGEFGDRRYPVAALAEQWKATAERKLRTAFDEALGGMPDDLAIHPMIVRGPAGAVLTEVANRTGDLLVVGAGRRGVLRHALHASTSRQCLARAKCAVIAVPPSPMLVAQS